MYLKSLELHGFKSFPDRTLLKFKSGATVIVGPNGSGKSNITDAMRWVLGELSSKSIRGSKMEDVIFAGTDEKKPMSFAEVSVTFDDSQEPKSLQSPYDEVTVTRRYFRSGESIYFINRKKVRLKDIYELFMNTGIGREGYSIIGQGKIAEIISKKSEDRRGAFEESAGISKYRYKKNESAKKIAETEANMERVGDIEHELSLRIGPLEKDAEKARRYLELYGEKKKTDISLWLYDSKRLNREIEKAKNDAEISSHELEMAEDSMKLTSTKIERLYEQSHDNKEASRRNYEEMTDATKLMNAAESESNLMTKERIFSENSLNRETALYESSEKSRALEEEKVAQIREKLNAIEASYTALMSEFENINGQIADIDTKIGEKTAVLDTMLEQQTKAEAALTDLKVRLNVLENNISNSKMRSETINSDIGKYEEEISSLDREAESAKKQIEEYNSVIREINENAASVSERISAEKLLLDGAQAEERKKHAELDSLDSRIVALKNMQEHFDGYNNSIKYVMNESRAGRLRGIRGPISYLIKVEEKYIVAIETSLGGAMQNIVTDDEDAAKRSIEALKRNSEGRATFYPLTTIRAQERGRDYDGIDRTAGFIGWADELITSDYEYRNIIKSLLARVAVYDNLDNATVAARNRGWKIRAVTLDGQQINAGGSFTGGQTRRDTGMLSRSAQIDSLRSARDNAALALEEINKTIAEIQSKIDAISSEAKSEEERKSLIESLIATENKSYSDADGRRKAISELVFNMKNDILSLEENESKSTDDLENMKLMISRQETLISDISAKRSAVASERGEEEFGKSELERSANDLKIRLAEHIRDREAAQIALAESKERLNRHTLEVLEHKTAIDALTEKIGNYSVNFELNLKKTEELKVRIDALTEKHKMLEVAGDDIEMQISALRQTEREQSSKRDIVFMANSKNEAKYTALQADEQKLTSKMWDDYELTFAAAVRFAEENDCHAIIDGERTSFVTLQNELKNKIRGLGHVNVDAVSEYNEVKERHNYIKTQLDDLRASREDLLKILNSIEEDMKKIFLEAFAKINMYFGEVFRELFGGGHAEVILSDPENVLECGIEINAAPPGKTIKNLSLLSGGEQAFIAIALLFALIRVNPSPFCIFDEIEAALDEVNITRVGRYIKKYSEEIQIIMISHRRGTMDIADTLYGVTMQNSGVSKVFTLNSAEDKDKLLKDEKQA